MSTPGVHDSVWLPVQFQCCCYCLYQSMRRWRNYFDYDTWATPVLNQVQSLALILTSFLSCLGAHILRCLLSSKNTAHHHHISFFFAGMFRKPDQRSTDVSSRFCFGWSALSWGSYYSVECVVLGVIEAMNVCVCVWQLVKEKKKDWKEKKSL